jgi:hypothetical protein
MVDTDSLNFVFIFYIGLLVSTLVDANSLNFIFLIFKIFLYRTIRVHL